VFEAAELGQKVSKAQYAKEEPAMREALLDAQYELLQQKRRSVVILVNGVDGAGKGESVNLLNEWMDPRHLRSVAFGAETDEERAHPTFWRFWRVLPPKGKVSVLFGSWYTLPILQRAKKSIDDAALDQAMDQIERFERMLAAEGVVLVKLWFHLSKKDQRKRFESLAADKRTRWRVTDDDWAHHAVYDRFRRISERALRRSSTGEAPWQVIDGSDDENRALSMGRAVLAGLRAATEEAPAAPPAKPAVAPKSLRPKGIETRTLLSSLDLTATLSEKVYEKRLEQLQGRLNALSRDKRFAARALAVVFEGMDAAGKGGAIRRVTRCLDARMYRVHPVAAPTDEERAQPYLWRFWRHAPPERQIAIFDRSWYGRVLVERVEGFCDEASWRRAYNEINDFEEQLVDNGTVVVKLWLSVSAEEQLKRFKEREATGFKRFKITPEDWRNREKWPRYAEAANEMFERTSTELAPWTLVAANDKRHARVTVLETLCARLEDALKKG
jgi:polyphosphate:AMP phosphotransferase